MRTKDLLWAVFITILGNFACPSGAVAAPVHQLVHHFGLPPRAPGFGSLTLGPDGYFWGTTISGGAFNYGTVFKVKPDLSEWTTVLSFTGWEGVSQGAHPHAGLVHDGRGFLWGTARQGGSGSYGTIFKIEAATGALTTMAEFSEMTEPGGLNRGKMPYSSLVDDGNGHFWGTTTVGGVRSGYGTVFKVNALSGALTTVVNFSSSDDGVRGFLPYAGLVNDGNGFLWGTTERGGSGGNSGTVFKINHADGTATTVLNFTGTSGPAKGRNPFAPLVSDGNGFLWGTTYQGGAGDHGTVYKINAASGEMTTVVEFTGPVGPNKGEFVYAGLVLDGAGTFWGTTYRGGAHGYGTVYKLNPSTGELTTVQEFTAGKFPRSPSATLIPEGTGSLMGTTEGGGEEGGGTVFRLNPASGALTGVLEFTGRSSTNVGRFPIGGLAGDSNGWLWGTASTGGKTGSGTIFKLNPTTRQFTTVVEFTGGFGPHQGNAPQSTLVADGSGHFWGTAWQGGATSTGTVFKLNEASGLLTTLLEFDGDGASNGGYPSDLVGDGVGSFWGATSVGGQEGSGTVFKINAASGLRSIVAQFRYPGGASPAAGLVSDGNGFFWGSTAYGGPDYLGTLYKIHAASGVLSNQVIFTGNGTMAKGSYPLVKLVNDGSGFLWGTTSTGGVEDYGTVFKVDRVTGTLTTISEFTGQTGPTKGRNPRAGLADDGAGHWWGTTPSGGVYDFGTVFKIDKLSGMLSTMIEFQGTGSQAAAGRAPGIGSLLRHTDGHLYGTTQEGGPENGGTIYRLFFGPLPDSPSAGSLTSSSALLMGKVNPHGAPTTYQFEYGLSAAALTLTTEKVSLAAGSAAVPVTAGLSGLVPGTTYYFRLRADNAEQLQTQYSGVSHFTTLTISQSGYADWIRTFPGGSDAPPTGDLDGDGLVNLIEYAFGLDPSGMAADQLPAGRIVDGNYEISFEPPPGVRGILYTAESSATLTAQTWEVVPDSGSGGRLRFLVPMSGKPAVFLRLRVHQP